MRVRKTRRPVVASGISLLEMLVALTILAISATVMFDWLLQTNHRLRRLEDDQNRTLAQLRAVEFLNGVNPATAPRGTQPFRDFVLEWQSEPVTPTRKALDGDDGQLPLDMAVYAVHARLLSPGDKPQVWLEFDTRLAGWSAQSGRGVLAMVAGAGAAP